MSGRVALGAILVAAGAMWLLDATGAVDISYRIAIGLLLVLIGLGIAVTRGHRVLLVVLGVLVALAGVPILLADDNLFKGGVGEMTETPVTAREIEPFRHAIGKLTVDLTSPDLDLDGARVEASLGIGDLVVVVPDDTDVDLDAHVVVGNADAFGQAESGFDVDLIVLSGTSGSQELELQLEVGIGNARVRRG